MYICIYVDMYVSTYICIYMYTCIFVYMYICIYVDMYVYMLIFRFTSGFSCPRVRVRPQGIMSPCQSSLASMPGSLEESPTSRQNVAADPKVGPCQWAMEPARNGWKKLVYSRHLYIYIYIYIVFCFFTFHFFVCPVYIFCVSITSHIHMGYI